jgi:hypothetical protein
MIQTVNILFHFYNLINLDDQEAKTKNKEINFVFENNEGIVSVRKTREIFENKAELEEIIKSDLGFHEIDYLEIFFWKKKSYNKSTGLPIQKYLVKLRNVFFDGFAKNHDTIALRFTQDRIDIPVDILSRHMVKKGKINELTKEKRILNFSKKEDICQKSLDIIHCLKEKF